MVFLSLWKLSNYLRMLIRPSLPKLPLELALYAIVGCDCDKYLTHLDVTDVGMRSILFKM